MTRGGGVFKIYDEPVSPNEESCLRVITVMIK